MTEATLTRRDALAAAAAGTVLASVRARAQDDALTELSTAEAGWRMAEGSLTSAALTRAYLDRIEALNRG